ncbi:MAG: hypothetical protein DRP01_08390, partial [Archaeoglobales archaeon]
MVSRWFKQDKSKEYQKVEPKSDRVNRKTSGFQIPKYKLKIETNVPADVFIDEMYKGTTPLTVEVIKGKHVIRLRRKRFKTIEKVIDVRRDETLNFNLELPKYGLLWSYKTGLWVRSVAISSDGKYVVAGSDDKKVYFFDKSGKLLWSYDTGDWVRSVAISSDGEYVVVGTGYILYVGGIVYFFDRSGKLLWSYRTADEVESVAISSDGEYVVAGSKDYKVYFFDRSGKLLWSYRTADEV